jgi:Flp pilus assembly protein TadD
MLGAASDPEPMVRAAAVRALGLLDARDERVLAVLMARVVDDARVVRARAAEALLLLDVVSVPGRAGEVLAKAQSDLAESLRSFPDSAPQQATLAWLHAQRGEVQEAERLVRAALTLDPTLARPHVIRGVLAARDGRFADAVASWKAARDLDPDTPNIERMIEEATRRMPPGR